MLAQQKKILVTGVTPDGIAELQTASPGATIVGASDQELMAHVADADAIIGTINPELVRAGKKLKWVQIGSAGVERYLHLSTPELKDSNIILTNGKIIQGPEIADHAFALLLTLTRDIRRYVLDQSKEEWPRGRERLLELRDKTALVIGVGGIGTQIAARAKAFGMKVIAVDPKDIPLSPFIDQVVQPNRLDTVIPEADVVFVAAPHTPESDQMIGSRQFDLMKQGAYFVAVSRGRLYSMDGLVRALDSKKLSRRRRGCDRPGASSEGAPALEVQ